MKLGIKWVAKAWLALVLLMVAGGFVAALLSDPFGSVTGAGVRNDRFSTSTP